ncbi:hypothetical protein IMY05_007G0117100 [Salix suchowensis]|nr:hypothetical protein IMY05_007G0117100 [Salix suchowensis]
MILARVPESHGFSQTDFVPIEQRPLQSSSSNSDFCFRNDPINLESPAADELFLNGKKQPLSPTPEPFLDAAITRNDSRYDQGSVLFRDCRKCSRLST